ncbi:unnamed protein product [Clonostachys rosea]|uniref:Uncharacterized protein n=1 Tax=Bionectria ochroleuca TaxID=29856 RepID=A0ABY6UVF4_BIOOC|nr:unnamed protein product [Clonostachys rosea]
MAIIFRVLGITINFLLALLGSAAISLATTNDTTIALSNASAQAAQYFSVLAAPAPDATKVMGEFGGQAQDPARNYDNLPMVLIVGAANGTAAGLA